MAQAYDDIISNILDLSKLEAGKLNPEKRPFDVTPMLQAIAQETQILLGPKKQVVQVTVQVNGPARLLLTDDIKLRQILTNLASNAAKFTEQGEICLTASFSQMHVRFTVRDTGIGIAPSELNRMFEPFEQADDAKSRRFDGTGLGLSIAKLLCGLLGGKIFVSSSLGQGSEFSIEIPIELPQINHQQGEQHDQHQKTHFTH